MPCVPQSDSAVFRVFLRVTVPCVPCAPQSDNLPVSEKVALQLAGLQSQVLLGDPKDKYDHYSDVATFLSQRIASTKRRPDWVS